MRLNPAAFNSWLSNIGQRYEWRKSYACPCISPHSGASKPGCPQCGGRGRIWVGAVAGVAGMAGSKTQREWAQFGLWENGDVVVTIGSDTPLYGMGQFDRVTALDNTDVFSNTLVRGQGDKLYGPVLSVERVFWLNDVGAIVDGGIPDVAADGTLTWSDNDPPAGATYTITGTRMAEYFCWGQYPSDRNMHSGAQLPRRVVLRKFDLYGRQGKV
jgi:hypothetical protein